jgi:hypothetical protein
MVSKADYTLVSQNFHSRYWNHGTPSSRWRSYDGLQEMEKDNTEYSNETDYNGTVVFSVAKLG